MSVTVSNVESSAPKMSLTAASHLVLLPSLKARQNKKFFENRVALTHLPHRWVLLEVLSDGVLVAPGRLGQEVEAFRQGDAVGLREVGCFVARG